MGNEAVGVTADQKLNCGPALSDLILKVSSALATCKDTQRLSEMLLPANSAFQFEGKERYVLNCHLHPSGPSGEGTPDAGDDPNAGPVSEPLPKVLEALRDVQFRCKGVMAKNASTTDTA